MVTQPPPAPTPGPGNPPSNPTGVVEITVTPNPVPHSGEAIADSAGCAGVRYTWFYEQVFRETGGSPVTFVQRIDSFDERETNNVSNLNIVVPANGTDDDPVALVQLDAGGAQRADAVVRQRRRRPRHPDPGAEGAVADAVAPVRSG